MEHSDIRYNGTALGALKSNVLKMRRLKNYYIFVDPKNLIAHCEVQQYWFSIVIFLHIIENSSIRGDLVGCAPKYQKIIIILPCASISECTQN